MLQEMKNNCLVVVTIQNGRRDTRRRERGEGVRGRQIITLIVR